MICGAQRYHVKIKKNREIYHEYVIARTPAEARKRLRQKLGRDLEILSVREQQRRGQILY